jgi:hypothetical protein
MNTKTKTNMRSPDVIADEYNALDSENIFRRGELLIEAKVAVEAAQGFGHWREWLSDNFEMSPDTAERLIKVAGLAAKLRQVKLSKTTLYRIADEDKDVQPAMIAALVKAAKASAKTLKPWQCEDIMRIERLRHQYGDGLPNATLDALYIADIGRSDVRDAVMKALMKAKPTTKQEADKVAETAIIAVTAEAFKQRPVPPNVSTRVDTSPPPAAPQVDDADGEGFGSDGLLDGELTEAGPPPGWSPPQSGNGQRPGDDLELELQGLLKVLLSRHVRRSPPTTLTRSNLSGTDLVDIANYVYALHRDRQGGDKVKIAADRAEAQSRAKYEAPF